MEKESFLNRVKLFYKRNRKVCIAILILIVAFVVLSRIGFKPLETADTAKQYILSYGAAAPPFFISIQVLQVIIAPLPGQAAGLAGGYVFGWQLGFLYTMSGLMIGTLIVLVLSRRLGRRFVEKLNGPEAVKDFEGLFIPREGKAGAVYGWSKGTVKSHGLLTFFIIMLLPAFPDDLVCFVAGLSRIPIWQLVLVSAVGRAPGMLVLSMIGDGFSQGRSNLFLFVFTLITVLVSGVYVWKKQQIDRRMRRLAGLETSG